MDLFRRHRLDTHTLDGLIEGASTVPAEARPLANLLRLATAPAHPEELRGEADAVAQFHAANAQGFRAEGRHRSSFLPKLLTMKALALLLGTATAGGFALAAGTGTLPEILTPDTVATSAPPSRQERSPASVPTSGVTGATAPAGVHGLCVAFLAKSGVERGRSLEGTAFEELIRAAGGREQVTAYCEAQVTTSPKDKPETPGNGPPSDRPGKPEKSEKPGRQEKPSRAPRN